ncbi:MAG: phosphatase PAP2 family protein [Burkholderiaceae bacterium]
MPAPTLPPAGLRSRIAALRAWQFALLALPLLLAWDASGLDLQIVRLFGSAGGFAWREQWLTAQLIHNGGRLLSAATLAFLLLLNLLPRRWLLPQLSRRERLLWLAVSVLSLLLISAIKRVSSTSCPYDLVEFGGVARYVSHWAFGLRDGGPGHCFPSGHASSAFAFMIGAFVLARAYPRGARAWLGAVLVLGLIYGLGQLVRGAHYPSHTLWTAWICWFVAAVLARRLLPTSH